MANKVLGRISTVLAVNAKPLQSGLNLAKGELESFATTVKSRLSSAGTSAERALKGMYTDFQRLERAVKAANSQQLNLKVQNPRAILDVARATERIAKPVTDAQKQFSALSQTVQSALLPVLQSGQKQAENFFDAISRNAKVTDRDFANTEARINRVTEAFRRATEASQATRGLASGQELRFQNPEFLRSTSRAAQLQQQAAQLSPEAISGRGIVSLIGQQRLAADEAERLRATIDRIAVTRRGDAQAAQQAYAQQLAGLERINNALEEQITLANRVTAANQQAANQRSAFDTRELDRRSGATARRRGNAFEDATAGVFGATGRQDERFIGPAVVSVDLLIGRIRELGVQYQQLPEAARAALQPQVSILNSIANAAASGSAGVGVLEDAYERTRVRIEEAADAAERARTSFVTIPGNPDGEFGPPRPFSDLTGNRDPRTRVLATLGQEVGDLRNRIRGVGETLAGDLGPTVDNLTTRFQNMARQGVGVAAEQARRLAQEVAGVNAALNSRQATGQRFAESFGGAGRAGLSLGVDERSLRAAGAQVEFVQERLSSLSQAVRGPVISALDAFRVRAQQLFEGGAIDTADGRRELQLLREELIRTLAAAGGGSERAIAQSLRRVGDVGRGGFDKFSLAVQQAAFVIDDFFSVSGGLDQRIRAVGNNISQLGFLIGGTWGLVAGVLVSVGSQATLALVNWYNAGVRSEDQTKALNDALARQKSLVDELAQAFRSLGDNILQGTLSPAAESARQLSRDLEELRNKQQDVRDSRLVEANQDVAAARGAVEARSRELQAAVNPADRLAAARALRSAQARERGAVDAARRPITDADISAIVDRTLQLERSARTDFESGDVAGLDTLQQRIRSAQRTRDQVDAARAAGDDAEAIRLQREELISRMTAVTGGDVAGQVESRQAALAIEDALNRLDFADALRLDEAAASIFEASSETANRIRTSQQSIADAIQDGIPGALAVSLALNDAGESLAQAQQAIIDRVEAGLPVDQSLIDFASEQKARADELTNSTDGQVQAIRASQTALERFSDALSKASQQAQQNVAAAESELADARAAVAQADFFRGGASQGDRDRLDAADQALREQREVASRLEEDIAAARDSFRRGDVSPELRQSAARAAEIDAQLKSFGVLLPETSEQLARERARLEQNAVDLNADVQRGLNDSNAIEMQRQSEIRGRELLLSPGQRVAEELQKQLNDVAARSHQRRAIEEGGAGRLDVLDRINAEEQRAVARLREDALRQQAPAIFGLADSVANALLQGPSRAALQPTDVSTVEGSRELTRLLRGDDAARDQANLVELQKEANRLLDLIANAPAPIAN